MEKNPKIGKVGMDTLTKKKGIITGFAQYQHGSDQYFIEGEFNESTGCAIRTWVTEERLEVLEE